MLIQNLLQYGGRLTLNSVHLKRTYTIQCHNLRLISSSLIISKRNDLLLQEKLDEISIRKQSTSTPPPNSTGPSITTDKNVTVIPPVSTVVKVRTRKSKVTDYAASYTENNFITAIRAMHEYLLKPSDLETLKQYKTRSPYSETEDPIRMLTVYRRGDVEKRAYEVWGSPEMLNKEKAKRNKARQEEYEAIFSLKKSVKEYQKRLLMLENTSFDNRTVKNSILTTGGGKVVVVAVLM
jgi:hypothetical protein